tara:strand:+ start:195 stop:785 length:591 start_codon:yes stop_codon:yes gene_type:complete
MKFDAVIERRKSVRSYKKKKPSFKLILEAIDAANQGPFAGNRNHLFFVIVEDPNKIQLIAKNCNQPWVNQAPTVVLICSKDKHLEDMYGSRGLVYSRQQAGAAINTFLLKTADLGLSSCWLGAYSDDIIKTHLKIPKNIQIEAILPVGYEKPSELSEAHNRKPKKRALDSQVYWESWQTTRRPSLFHEGKDHMSLK